MTLKTDTYLFDVDENYVEEDENEYLQ